MLSVFERNKFLLEFAQSDKSGPLFGLELVDLVVELIADGLDFALSHKGRNRYLLQLIHSKLVQFLMTNPPQLLRFHLDAFNL